MAPRTSAAAVRVGLAISQLGSKVREESLARTTPALVEQAVRVVEARSQRQAQAMAGELLGFLERNATNPGLPPAIGNLFGSLFKAGTAGLATALSTAIGFGVGQALGSVLEPMFTGMAQVAWKNDPVQVLGLDLLAEEVIRGIAEPAQVEEEAARQGFNRDRLLRQVALARTRVQLSEVLELRNRGAIDDEEAGRRMIRLGYSDEVAGELLSLRRRVPPAGDVVRFAVREVYNPPLRQELGYEAEFADLDPQVLTDAEAAGITKDDMFNYWIAHWELPSPSQAYEMLHRGLITTDQLAQLLKAADYPLPWRERLEAIAYLIPGRVDTRRMYRAGVISREEVQRNYLALGYEPRHAATLTEFAVAEAQEEDRGLAKTEVVQLYTDGHLERPRATELLGGLGYGADDAGFILDIADYRNERRFRDQVLRTIRARYVAHKIDENDAQRRMDELGVAAGARDLYLALWDLERVEVTADLTEAQVRAAWRKGVVPEDYYHGWLIDHGYSEDEATILIETNRPAPTAGA